MDCCPYCLAQVTHIRVGTSSVQIIRCPTHGDMPASFAVKGK